MSARRVLLMAYFFPPLAGGGVHRALSFVRHLPAHGWACTVVCAGPEDYWVRDESLLARVPAETEVIRVSGGSALSAWLAWRRRGAGAAADRRPSGAFGLLRRASDWWLLPDSYAGWAARAREAAAARLQRGDVHALLSTSPPDSVHLAARALAERTRVPWVADFRDPWIGLHFKRPPTAWHRARQAAMERAVVTRADRLLAASRAHADDLEAMSGRRGAVVHLPNGFEPAVEPPADASGTAPASASGDDAFRLAFTGTLSLMPEANTFLEAVHDVLARRPEARQRLRVDLVGPYESDHEDRAAALGLSGVVRFHGARPHAETRAIQRRADALVLWRPAGEGYRTMVPGKLYEYLDAGRPVLALWPGDEEAAQLVRRGGGVVVAPGDRAALAREVETRYMAWKDSGPAPRVRPDWLSEHERPALASRLARELDQLVGGTR